MNKGIRLTGIVLLSTVLHYPAIGASICQDRNAAIAIADLTMQMTDLEINGGAEPTIAAYQQRIAQLARAHCVVVDSYPPERTSTPMKWGCRIFSGALSLSGGEGKTHYWTRCPKPVE
jgi:hypothetical protein